MMFTAEQARDRRARAAVCANDELSGVLLEIKCASYTQDELRHIGYLEDETLAALLELGYAVVAHCNNGVASYDIRWVRKKFVD